MTGDFDLATGGLTLDGHLINPSVTRSRFLELFRRAKKMHLHPGLFLYRLGTWTIRGEPFSVTVFFGSLRDRGKRARLGSWRSILNDLQVAILRLEQVSSLKLHHAGPLPPGLSWQETDQAQSIRHKNWLHRMLGESQASSAAAVADGWVEVAAVADPLVEVAAAAPWGWIEAGSDPRDDTPDIWIHYCRPA